MIETLYLHAGMHKTATTALQIFLAKNTDVLAPYVLYPSCGRAKQGAHHHLFSSIRTPNHPAFPPCNSFQGYLRNLYKEVGSARRVLLSSEILSGNIDLSLLGSLTSISDSVRIILYLRPQYAYIVSLYNELVKNTNWVKPFPVMLDTFDADYYPICQKWCKLFGTQCLIVRPFQSSQLVGNDIFADFLDIFGLSLTEEYVIPDKIANPTRSRNAVEFKRAVNFLCLSGRHARRLRALLKAYSEEETKAHTTKGGFISAQKRVDIMARYSNSNSRIAKEFMGREHGNLFPGEDVIAKNTGNEHTAQVAPNEIKDISRFIREFDAELFSALTEAISSLKVSDTPDFLALEILQAISDVRISGR